MTVILYPFSVIPERGFVVHPDCSKSILHELNPSEFLSLSSKFYHGFVNYYFINWNLVLVHVRFEAPIWKLVGE